MNILILGANSDIAKHICDAFAKEKDAHFYLASRNTTDLEKFSKDLTIRHQVKASYYSFDATNFTSHQKFYDNLPEKPDLVVVAFGLLGEQQLAEKNFQHAAQIINTNYTGAVSILEIVAADFAARKSGTIIGISSVAGLRGRQSNYIYGSAKAAFTTYLSGLRNRMQKHNVHVMTILPGFVATKMTQDMDLPQRLTAQPKVLGQAVYQAYSRGKNTMYHKKAWCLIMFVIRSIPESIFKRLSL